MATTPAASAPARIIFRADGNATIGLGHLVRSLALADMVRPLAECRAAVQAPAPAVRQLVREAGVALWELPVLEPAAEAPLLAAQLCPTDVVVLDGYGFDTGYQQTLAASGCRLVAIDDLRAWPMAVELVINHSPGVTATQYRAAPGTRFCLGPDYSLLRPPFLTQARPPAPPAPIASVLLCFGGADPQQLTQRCLALLLALPALREVGVITGGAFPHSDALQTLAAASPTKTVRFYANVAADEIVALLHQYQAVVCPASTILIESLVLGKAALTGYYADNQRHLAAYVQEHQQAYSLGDFTALSEVALQQALVQGLEWLAREPRQPYAPHLAPEQLRAEFRRLLPA
ncbi:UDP-2,4-diacetamido-2,4,6-trideoxy-beta-L-altropyranose hydrolase [Hymenobacter daecheongensis DSM 21074]|uniref:UDP-2,4-diacetamido-2,4,6-trideoxy-beta-L-altropyranose hydrolase n=1 Tax=Hymenobacter daecheongensis DSM 21074 TaxID=1121955 RepID=A0A1M6EHY8_9BACT|nr:UDP-2,4-diacetamido-2,4,6-trideoxy-beta-L-altropyranose hydrolase [Hymenobacter daecheongensis]SHI85085.1 UDP-2,4-diacetamido-2,4,6-trideoxy-beta-L-altropyranose hydrolase [Hymenobacter daecheongensis DSM 21074]